MQVNNGLDEDEEQDEDDLARDGAPDDTENAEGQEGQKYATKLTRSTGCDTIPYKDTGLEYLVNN